MVCNSRAVTRCREHKTTAERRVRQLSRLAFSALFDPFDPPGDNGLSPFDRRHKFVASVVYNTNFTGLSDTGEGDPERLDDCTNRQHVFRIPLHCCDQYLYSFNRLFLLDYFRSQPGRWHQRFEWFASFRLDAKQRVPYAINQVRRSCASRVVSRSTEDAKLELLAEGFNIFNRTQVTGVNNRMYQLSAPTRVQREPVIATFDPTFGTPSDLSNGFFFRERQIQLAVRFEF